MLFKHDCKKCIPLGEFYGEDRTFDLYFCSNGGPGPTLVARYGSDGPEYISGAEFAGRIPAITEAKRRAIDAGYKAFFE